MDAYAHAAFPELESFSTPWHAVFCSGFAATPGAVEIEQTVGPGAGAWLAWWRGSSRSSSPSCWSRGPGPRSGVRADHPVRGRIVGLPG
ncbi:hypothetical protein [Pseudonocardia sp. T1-2H]|uniref:hypothetical protein n=1 Tax=Pseudonocardia sp. T1-2H TaxID=3128899 RepID=UPI00310159B0